MVTFVYIGGTQQSGSVQEITDQKGKTHVFDDRQEEPMPAEITAFNHTWLRGQPTLLDPKKFDTRARYEHALRKLRGSGDIEPHKHFKEVDEVLPEAVEPAPIKARGRPAKPLTEPDAE